MLKEKINLKNEIPNVLDYMAAAISSIYVSLHAPIFICANEEYKINNCLFFI